ncbi:Sulfurtransferase TusA [Neomoorella glycerini]|uniref:Sulfurtransferase TusA n=1 Tax=Neomoorella glycerini TaxID=55779 RepID=A0A6I5ZW97_9FIRM|nr:sulfurtransferase TusA family protein [Moorella glycerini]QGP93969.1 Sulfurtransferase TusA [Moorella glycerini]
MVEVDVRGLSCPIPVVKTKKAMEQNPGQPLKVLTDNETSRENVSRLAENRGYQVQVEKVAGGYRLVLTPGKS